MEAIPMILSDRTDTVAVAVGVGALKRAVHQCAIDHGWWEGGDRNMGELIALMHSELSEALEAWRDDEPMLHYKYPNHAPARYETANKIGDQLGKPCGLASEFADVVIRILDACEHYSIPITTALLEKHQYNLTRAYRHGGKKA